MSFFRALLNFVAGRRNITIASRSCWSASIARHPAGAGITYQDALDEALCFGWIDGIRKRLDDTSYNTASLRVSLPASGAPSILDGSANW